jgi:hypothetical protein
VKTIPETVLARWLSGELVGQAKHQMVVRVRPGVVMRQYAELERIDLAKWPHVTPMIYDGDNSTPWQGQWVPLGDWVTLPHIQSSKYTRSFDQNGSSTLTVVQDNIAFTPQSGFAGIYRNIERGYFSPSRGIVLSSRPSLWTETGWTDVLNGGYQIELWEGYGLDRDPSVIPLETPDPVTHSCAPPDAAISRTWTGLIETVDLESQPDHITLTCRDFGILFTDQYLQHANKDPAIIAPTTFADRRTTMGEQAVQALLPPPSGANGGGLQGNSYEAVGTEGAYLKKHGYFAFTTSRASSRFTTPADAKVDTYNSTYPWETTSFVLANGWVSAAQAHPNDYQWLEMDLPAGEYSEFDMALPFAQEAWVSIYVGPGGGWYDDKTGLLPEGWADPDGNGDTPLGIPFVHHFGTVPPSWVPGTDKAGNVINATTYAGPLQFGHDFVVPKGSKLRVTFGKLKFRDPSYDTAPPFPAGLWEKLTTEIQSVLPVRDARDLVARDQKGVDAWSSEVNKMKAWQSQAHHWVNTPSEWPSWWTDVMRGQLNNVPAGSVKINAPVMQGTTMGPDVLVLPNPHSPDGFDYFATNYDHGQIDRANDKKSWSSEPVAWFDSQLKNAEAQLDAWQRQLKGDQEFLDQAIKAKSVAATAKARLAALMSNYKELWIKDSHHRPGYYAGCNYLRAYRVSKTDPSVDVGQFDMGGAPVNAEHWVLVDDASEVITQLCIWLGFKEWDIDRYGWSLVNPMQWGIDKFFIDVVNDMLGQGNYVFFMGPPTEDDRSIGVPSFKQQRAVANPVPDMLQVDDHLLTEAAQMKWDLSTLPGQFIYRGDPVPTDGSRGPGQTYENDLVDTYMATYVPPWAGAENWTPLDGSDPMTVDPPNRVAGVMRHFIQTVGVNVVIGLTSNEECLFACLLAAVQYALGIATGQVQVPGLAVPQLNDQISVVDEGSGINSRMWIASIDSEHTGGSNGMWKMVISGSYIDHVDMVLVLDDYWAALKAYQALKQDPITLVPVGQVGF